MKRLAIVAAALLLVGGAALGLAQMQPTPRETVQVLTVPLPPATPAATAPITPAAAPVAPPVSAPPRASIAEAPKAEPARKTKAKEKGKTTRVDG
jgi:hypothetical protein